MQQTFASSSQGINFTRTENNFMYKTPNTYKLCVLSWNVNDQANIKLELEDILSRHEIDVAAIQETKPTTLLSGVTCRKTERPDQFAPIHGLTCSQKHPIQRPK